MESLYIHVPFCFHKCHYCDFYSFVDTRQQQGAFLEALLIELEMLAPHAGHLQTIFAGGGTPSLLEPGLWAKLLGSLEDWFGVRGRSRAGTLEFTVECNPETVTPELMAIFAAGGVNRVSIGAQSFQPGHLKTLERWHDPANVRKALELAAAAGIHRRNIDLIFAIPGQTVAEWSGDLQTALALADPRTGPGLDHLSCYDLTYEPNTAMTKRLQRGEFDPVEETVEIEMFRLTRRMLADAGFAAYEVSNFARPGAECRHNLGYWRQSQWLAAGPSASAHVGGWRWKNAPHLDQWMQGVRASGGFSPVQDLEPPDPRRALAERIMTGLRLAEGLDKDAALSDAAALGASDPLIAEADRQIRRGLLESFTPESGASSVARSPRWRVTEPGTLQADAVAAAMMAALRTAQPRTTSSPDAYRSVS